MHMASKCCDFTGNRPLRNKSEVGDAYAIHIRDAHRMLAPVVFSVFGRNMHFSFCGNAGASQSLKTGIRPASQGGVVDRRTIAKVWLSPILLHRKTTIKFQ